MAMVKKYCPNCKKRLMSTDRSHDYNYGSPLKLCPYCRQFYVDKQYHEIAIEGVRAEDKKRLTLLHVLQIFAAVALIGFFLWVLTTGATIADVGPALFTPIFFAVILRISPAVSIVGYKERLNNFAKEAELSEKRLQDINYAKTLMNLGYPVPTKYLGIRTDTLQHEELSNVSDTATNG